MGLTERVTMAALGDFIQLQITGHLLTEAETTRGLYLFFFS